MAPWAYTGGFAVGVADVAMMDPVGGVATSDRVDFTKHLVGRLYYPTLAPPSPSASSLLPLPLLPAWRRRGIPWLPGLPYARGLGRFLFFRSTGLAYRVLEALVTSIAYAFGKAERVDLHPGAALASTTGAASNAGGTADGGAGEGDQAPPRFPVCVFSHGLGGNRGLYSVTCGELASQGYVVLAVEHCDGSASCACLATGQVRLYQGLGGEEGQVQKLRDRVTEMKTALRVLRALAAGEALPGLSLSHRLDPGSFLAGRLDLACLAAMGHSYGGATVTALVAEDPAWGAAVALDPWWPPLPSESPALSRFLTRTPIMIQPSHDWSVPNAWGQLTCDGERQAAVLAAARGEGRGGAIKVVLAGSSHNTFADAVPLFSKHVGWLLERLGLSARLDPVLGAHLSITASLAFLSAHLPLSAAQRRMQSWAPGPSGAGGTLQALVRQRDAADRGETGGLFSRLWPRGKGLLEAASDWVLNVSLRQAGAGVSRPASRQSEAGAAEGDGSRAGSRPGSRAEAPDDVGTGMEALEALLPSADPASGKHPHAPGRRTDSVDLGAALAEEAAAATASGGASGLAAEARCRRLLVGLGTRHSPVVTNDEVEALRALLGQEHIFLLEGGT